MEVSSYSCIQRWGRKEVKHALIIRVFYTLELEYARNIHLLSLYVIEDLSIYLSVTITKTKHCVIINLLKDNMYHIAITNIPSKLIR